MYSVGDAFLDHQTKSTQRGWVCWKYFFICPTKPLLVLTLLFPFAGSSAEAQIRGDVELLKLAASGHQANKERIRTWSGSVQLTDTNIEEGGPKLHKISHVEYAYDCIRKAMRWNRHYKEFVRTEANGTVTHPSFKSTCGMLKEGALYRLLDLSKGIEDNKTRPTVTVSSERPILGPTSEDFDPMYWFTDHGQPLEDRFIFLYKNSKDKGLNHWQVTRHDNRVIVEYVEGNDGRDKLMNRYEVDLSQGCNLVAYDASEPSVTEKWRLSFTSAAGVWVPSRISYECVHVNRSRVAREMEWVENVVNEPLSSTVFELETLGVTKGDRLYDTRINSEHVFKTPEGRPKVSKSLGRFYFLVLNALVIAGIVLFLITRRIRSARRRM